VATVTDAGVITLASLEEAFFAMAERTAEYPTYIAMHPRLAHQFREMVGLNSPNQAGSAVSSIFGMQVEYDSTMDPTEIRMGNTRLVNLEPPQVQALSGWDLIPEPYRTRYPKSTFFFDLNKHLDFLFECIEAAKNIHVVILCPNRAMADRTSFVFREEVVARKATFTSMRNDWVGFTNMSTVRIISAGEFHRHQEGRMRPDFIIVKELIEELR
jgi:hypothetical protein